MRRRTRLFVQPLENRLAPANNLTITNDPTSFNVVVGPVDGNVSNLQIQTTGPGARLSLAHLQSVLEGPGQSLVITTAADDPAHDGQEAGNILWPAAAGNLDLGGARKGLVTFRTAAGLNAVGDIDLHGVTFDDPDGVPFWLRFETTATNGSVTFHDDGTTGVRIGPVIGALYVYTGTGAFRYEGNGGAAGAVVDDQIRIEAGTIDVRPRDGLVSLIVDLMGAVTVAGTLQSTGLGLDLDGPVTLAGDTTLSADWSQITVTGPVDGPHALTVRGGLPVPNVDLAKRSVRFEAAVGSAVPLTELTVAHGGAFVSGGTINAGVVRVGTGSPDGPVAGFGANGTLTGDMIVAADGVLSAGAVEGLGALTVNGDLTIDGGIFAPDFGPSSDTLTVTGNVTLNGAVLGGGFGRGQLPGAPHRVLDVVGTLTGTFVNAPIGAELILGADAVRLTSYDMGVVVAPLPVGPRPRRLTGTDADGTKFTATVSRSRELVTGMDVAGRRFLVVRGEDRPAAVTVTTRRTDGSDDAVAFDGGVVVSYWLSRFIGPKVDVGDRFLVKRPAALPTRITSGTIVLRDLLAGGIGLRVEDVASRTALRARHLAGSVRSPALFTSIRTSGVVSGFVEVFQVNLLRAREISGQINAPILGTVVVTGAFTGEVRTAGFDRFRAGSAAGLLEGAELGPIAVTGPFAATVRGGTLTRLSARQVVGAVLEVDRIGPLRSAGTFDATIRTREVASLTARSGAVGITLTSETGTLGPVRVTDDLSLQITGGSVASVRVGGTLRGFGPSVVGRTFGSLVAGAIDGLDLTAVFTGPIRVTGNRRLGLSGDVRESVIRGTGFNGFQSLTVAGDVIGTSLLAPAGHIGPVVVGRFLDSRLYANYTPAGGFNTGGSFGGPGHYTLTSFTTTAPAGPSPVDGRWAFENSEVAANGLSTIHLTGLKTANAGTAFGFKMRSPFGGLTVSSADNPGLIGVNLPPWPTALSGDFFVLDV